MLEIRNGTKTSEIFPSDAGFYASFGLSLEPDNKRAKRTNVDVKESNRMKHPPILRSILFCLSFGVLSCFADPPKVIIDTDFNTIGDDGQVAVMAAQLYAQGTIDLLGFTIPSGNQWRDQEVSDCLKAVERLGIENQGEGLCRCAVSNSPRLQVYLYEEQLFGKPIDYVGAYSSPQPNPNQLVPPPDGFATHTKPAKQMQSTSLLKQSIGFPTRLPS